MAIDSTTTDLGHLAIITTDEEFETLNGGPYIIPADQDPLYQTLRQASQPQPPMNKQMQSLELSPSP